MVGAGGKVVEGLVAGGIYLLLSPVVVAVVVLVVLLVVLVVLRGACGIEPPAWISLTPFRCVHSTDWAAGEDRWEVCRSVMSKKEEVAVAAGGAAAGGAAAGGAAEESTFVGEGAAAAVVVAATEGMALGEV